MKKNIFITLLFLISNSVFAAKIPQSWLGKESISRSFSKDNFSSLEKSFQNILNTQEEVFSKAVSDDNQKWYLQSILTEFAVEAEGEFGLLGGGGESALEFVWTRKNKQNLITKNLNSIDVSEDEGELPNLEIRSEMDDQAIEKEIEPIAKLAMASGFVRNKKRLLENLLIEAKKFQTTVRDIESSPVFGPWYVYKYQLEFYVSVEGKITLVDLGSSVRLRMEWWRLQKTNSDGPKSPYRSLELSPNATLISNLGQDLQSINQIQFENDFKLNCMKIGIGTTVEGNLFLVKGKSKVVGALFFKRDEVKPEQILNPKFDSNERSYSLAEKGKIFEINRGQFKQALIKSANILKFFSSKAKVKPNSFFDLNVIEGEFELFSSGGVGLVTLEGSVGLTLFVTRNVII